ncbi:hypothetical protein CO154_00335 [Candidatus Pacearchaeota archaeon CG_4_9_14_3_um_filter_31_7]|nr:MAG: hypothetical protein COU55_00425 [Candidatus Pacearchaeota archaeon CG10_big_fil_rev_8_21_14_0_10_31_59]PIZ81188.1 MAG: hypothetical protein COX99_00370 [Candidatus Pacearchaeota archaeon CG_4_10_14_0_2_um_filter_31_10]PJA70923.1 MAG: hypothetical protein CO154_00335 [Candidatus Pacearchaeota archaeon CG_4_9_14_3_um_filter_31_7]
MARVIVVTSGKGGVGKTTTAVNLSMALNNLGKDVCLVDTNLTTPNVGIHLGAPVVPINLHHVLSGKNKIHEAIYLHHSGTKIVPASLSLNDLNDIKYERLKYVLRDLRRFSDILVLDSAAGLGQETISSIRYADEIIVVNKS